MNFYVFSITHKRLLVKFLYVIFFLFILLLLNIAHAEQASGDLVATGGMFDSMIKKFATALRSMGTTFTTYGVYLLSALFVINWVWRIGTLMYRGNDLSSLFFEMIRSVLIFGFFLWILNNLTDIMSSLFSGFGYLANIALGGATSISVTNFGPSEIIDMGMDSITKVWSAIQPPETDGIGGTVANVGNFIMSAIVALFCTVILVVCWVYVAVQCVIVSIGFYFIGYCGCFILGLAGTEWTRNSALSFCNALLAAAVKYFATICMAILCFEVYSDCVNKFTTSENGAVDGFMIPLLTLVTMSIFAFLMVDKLPNMVASIISPATNGMGVSAAGFLAASQISKAASMAVGGVMAAGAVSKMATGGGVNMLKSALSTYGGDTGAKMASGIDRAQAMAGKGMSMAGNAIHNSGLGKAMGGAANFATGGAFRSGVAAHEINNMMKDQDVHGKFMQEAESQGLNGSAAESYASRKTADFNQYAKHEAQRYSRDGTTASNAASNGMAAANRMFFGNVGDRGTTTSMNSNTSEGNSENTVAGNFSNGSASPSEPFNPNEGDTQSRGQAGYQNVRDDYKDPVKEDPVTDMNADNAGDHFSAAGS